MTSVPVQSDPSGAFKGAILLAGIGRDQAARILSFLPDDQVQQIAHEFSRLNHVSADQIHEVAREFEVRLEQLAGSVTAGPDFARQMLERAVGLEKAIEILGVEEMENETPSLAAIVDKTSPDSIAAVIVDEHPQIIALLLDRLDADRAASVLSALPPEIQGQVTARLARTETPSHIAVAHLEKRLFDKLKATGSQVESGTSGPQRVADILGRMQRSSESFVLNSLQEESPQIAEEVNQYRFGIEHFLELDDRTIQRVLREVEHDKMVLIMKGLETERHDAILKNMSERGAARLSEDLAAMGPARLRDVESAQRELVAAARRLEEEGEISLRTASGGGSNDEEEFV
jgi:flagellar motor switch protein FliG